METCCFIGKKESRRSCCLSRPFQHLVQQLPHLQPGLNISIMWGTFVWQCPQYTTVFYSIQPYFKKKGYPIPLCRRPAAEVIANKSFDHCSWALLCWWDTEYWKRSHVLTGCKAAIWQQRRDNTSMSRKKISSNTLDMAHLAPAFASSWEHTNSQSNVNPEQPLTMREVNLLRLIGAKCHGWDKP